MEFCPNCGSRLEPKKSHPSAGASFLLACLKCGYTKRPINETAEAKKGKVIQPKAKPFMTVISEEDQKINTMPTLRVECEKCHNMEVYVWQVQTRGGDEASTQFMRCTKCGHTFREYS
jgi:DNA-directed RNA polymerase subunit M